MDREMWTKEDEREIYKVVHNKGRLSKASICFYGLAEWPWHWPRPKEGWKRRHGRRMGSRGGILLFQSFSTDLLCSFHNTISSYGTILCREGYSEQAYLAKTLRCGSSISYFSGRSLLQSSIHDFL